MTPPLTCSSGVELLMDYLEGVLPLGQRARIDAHMAACPRCVAFVTSYRETPGALRRATHAEPPPHLGRGLLAFVRERG